MIKRLLLLPFLVTLLFAAPSTAAAQGYVVWSSTGNTPGVDMPLFRFGEYFGRDSFQVGDLNASYSLVHTENYPTLLEPTVITMWMSANSPGAPAPHAWNLPGAGPAVYPHRLPRVYRKEIYTYNGIDWRTVVPPAGSSWSYTQYAYIEWGAGTSIYGAGNTYAAGQAIIAFDYTISR